MARIASLEGFQAQAKWEMSVSRIKKCLSIVLASVILLGVCGLGLHSIARAKRLAVLHPRHPCSVPYDSKSAHADTGNFVRAATLSGKQLSDEGTAHEEPPHIQRSPAEFEWQRALLVSGQHLLNGHTRTLASIVAATRGNITLVALIGNDTEQVQLEMALRDQGIDASHVLYVGLPHDSKWIRDFGPKLVERNDGSIVVIDAHYGERDRVNDDVVPTALAHCLNLPVVHAPIVADGGNLLTNGDGLFITTERLIDQNTDEDLNSGTVAAAFRKYYGASETVILMPLVGEPTGHIDVFATFCDPDTIIVGSYDPDVDSVNAAILDRNAERLAKVTTGGEPLRVVRVPMPPGAKNCWRSYTNVIYANGVLLMPTYPDADEVAEAMVIKTYKNLMPGWRVITIDAEALCAEGGALHCVTANLPLVDRLPLCWNMKSFLDKSGQLPESFSWPELCDYHGDDLRRLYRASSHSPSFDIIQRRGSYSELPPAR